MKKRTETWIVRIPISRDVTLEFLTKGRQDDETIEQVRKNVCEHDGLLVLPEGWVFNGEVQDEEKQDVTEE